MAADRRVPGRAKATGKTRPRRAAAHVAPQWDGNGADRVPAVDLIRDQILALTLRPGARIDDKVLIQQFGLGRTPAREAFNRLAAEGFIIIERNKGATVRPLDLAHVSQFFDAYGASERLVGFFCRTRTPSLLTDLGAIEAEYELADGDRRHLDMTRLNADFHRRIALACGNEYVFDFASRLYDHARRLSYFVYLMPGDVDDELAEMQRSITSHHHDIMAAVRAHDNERLIEALSTHADYFHHWVVRAIGSARGTRAPLPRRSELRGA